jgi:PAS domain S-box-containing protein
MPTGSTPPPLDSAALREIVEGTAAETGERFFDELVKHLARAIGTKCAWVTEWLESERRLRALSFWVGDGYYGDFEYDIADTPCEPVIENRRLIHVPERVLELYAHDPSLEPLGAVSYMGVPLFDTDGTILGHLALLHDEPLPEDERFTGIFNIFAGRAAAELRRLRRDRDLREREQKLSRLIESAMDAIVELDGDLRVASMNSAAERVFSCDAATVRGQSFDAFLTRQSRGKLAYIIADLARRPEGEQSLWIPDGLDAVAGNEVPFPAEATLSRFEIGGRPFYTLILRNVNERREAEERIRDLTSETEYLRAEIAALHGFDEIVGRSAALRRVLADVERVAGTETTVLITGETGTGKELIARAIHRRSARSKRPLITVNCAAIAANLQESEFFGHERGAFTGATQRRDGRFKLADGGTIFLDEVGEMPVDLQAKLLRVLQEGEFQPVGGSRTVRVDVRVIAATNRDLERMAREGTFRTDLLYRLNVFPLHVPPLRERGEDVVLLAETLADKFARRRGSTAAPLVEPHKARLLAYDRGSTAAPLVEPHKARLLAYDWPGNVRELQNVIERALITSPDGRRLDLDRALPQGTASPAGAETASRAVDPPGEKRILTAAELRDLERDNLLRALKAAGWKVSGPGGAAERLGMKPNTLGSRMKALGIRRPGTPEVS